MHQYRLILNRKKLTLSLVLISFYLILSLLISSYNSKKYFLGNFNLTGNRISEGNFVPSSNNQEITVKAGDTLKDILKFTLLDKSETHKLIQAIKTIYDPKKLAIGQKIYFSFQRDEATNLPLFQSMKIKISYEKEIEIIRTEKNNFIPKTIEINFVKNIIRVKGKISNSLLATANSLKIPNDSLHDIIKAYSYDVDFQREIQSGDEIDVFFEKFYDLDGNFSHNGQVIYASLSLSDRKLDLYRYTNKYGQTDYYNKDGSSVKKDLLKTPINIVKISSGFGHRKHPILGYTKMHKGVDFAAPFKTPILAAGNGIIDEIGWKGAYGNYIRIKHNNTYSTAYAHASSFNKNLRRGSVVKQGDVIAYVGATGRASGPHLHYEVLINNQHVNPLKIKVNSGAKLLAEEFKDFNSHKVKIENLLGKTSHNEELAYNILYSKK